MSYCEYLRNKTGRSQSRLKKLWLLQSALHAAGRSKKPWRLKCDVLKLDLVGNGKPHSGNPVQSQHNKVKHCLPIYVILHQWAAKRSSNNNKFYLWFLVFGGILKHGSTRIDEPMLWRLKTEYYIIRWLCKGSFILLFHWLNESQEWWHSSREWEESLSSGLEEGQRTMALSAPRTNINTSLCSALFHSYTIIPSFHSLPV